MCGLSIEDNVDDVSITGALPSLMVFIPAVVNIKSKLIDEVLSKLLEIRKIESQEERAEETALYCSELMKKTVKDYCLKGERNGL